MHRFVTLVITALFVTRVSAAEPQIIHIKTLQAKMRYDVKDFTVRAGADVKIVFENMDDMPHNLVLFDAGTDVLAVSAKNMEKPDEALKRDWLPVDPRMLAHSKAVAPKTKDEIVFKAPDKSGVYPYVCTFPGHAASMQGKMQVVTPGPGLTGLKFALYEGNWPNLPDFSSLKPHREGAIDDNLIQLKFDDYKNQYGIVYTGKLNAPKDGEYTFYIAGDDGVRLFIDGTKVVDHDGIHASTEIKEGRIKLKAGEHDLRFLYFQGSGESAVYVAWRSKDFTHTPLSKWVHPDAQIDSFGPKKMNSKAGMQLVAETEPIIYRNFITNAGGRAVGVGYPDGFNLAWSAEKMNLTLLWRGAFIDASKHWSDRGGGDQAPLGQDVVRPTADVAEPFAILPSPDAEWPKSNPKERSEEYSWKGYRLDENRRPTFAYTWKDVKVTDRFDPEGDATDGGKLVRTLKLTGSIPPNTYLRVASGTFQPVGSGFTVAGGAFNVAATGAKVAGTNLIVPARSEIKITYMWSATKAQSSN
jgi:azurin